MATHSSQKIRPARPVQSGGGPLSIEQDDALPSGYSRIRSEPALTFDDVLLLPAHSIVHPRDVVTASRFTRGITLNVPLVSAAMDTVTESEMAIAMARAGGIGVLHKNMSIDRQAAEVDRVKRSESGMILKPITLSPAASLREAVALMHRFRISGVPIVDDEKARRHHHQPRPAVRAQSRPPAARGDDEEESHHGAGGHDARRSGADPRKHRIEKLPVVDEEGNLRGLITVKDIHKRRQFPNANKDQHGRLRVAAAIGAANYEARARALIDAGVDALIIDTAHGHREGVLRATADVRERSPTFSSSPATSRRAGARALVERGVDAVKVGVGPGSICTTRVVTGVGVPQLTAVFDAVEGAGDVPVIADGGIKYSGDAVKALAAGASSVMMGSMLAGTEESPGESLLLEGRRFKMIRGMGSLSAMQDGSADRYFQEGELSPRSSCRKGSKGACRTRGLPATCCSRWSADCAAAWATWAAGRSTSCARRPSSFASPRRDCASRIRTT